MMPPIVDEQTYEARVEARLGELDVQIKEVRISAEKAIAQMEAAYFKAAEGLGLKEATVRHDLRAMRESGEEAAREMQSDLEAALTDLVEAIERARQQFGPKQW